jgi:hypothetical protein
MAKQFKTVDQFTYYANSQDSNYPVKASREQYARIWARLDKFNGVVDYTTLNYTYYSKPKPKPSNDGFKISGRWKKTVIKHPILAEGVKQGKLDYITGNDTLRRRQERAINCIQLGTRTFDDYDEQWLRIGEKTKTIIKKQTPPIPAPRYTRPENLPPPPPELLNDNWFLPDF